MGLWLLVILSLYIIYAKHFQKIIGKVQYKIFIIIIKQLMFYMTHDASTYLKLNLFWITEGL